MSNKDAKDPGKDEGAAALQQASQIEDAEIIESTPTKQAPSGTSASRLPQLSLALSLIALVLLFGALGYGYQYWTGLQASLLRMNEELGKADAQQQALQGKLSVVAQAFEQQKQEIENQRSALELQEQKLVSERERLSQQASEMQQSLESVYSRVGRSSNAWMAAEAEYLMRVANHRLQLAGDVDTAIRALEAADGRLRDSGDPGWIEVRELLAKEIATLKGVGQLDRVGLAARLNGLKEQVKALKMLGLSYTPAKPEQGDGQADSAQRSVETLLKDGWEGFKSVMVIRHRDKPVSAMLPPEQQFFVYQNLQLQLEAARLALLKGDQQLYGSSLKQAAAWIGEFFDADATATQAAQQEISALQSVDVHPRLPDISHSLVALQARVKATGDEGAR
ncbi:uroporphyrinogen-III C-methyltransferase [Sedimenticola selenatireducens]|uniref:uroporphyrinogen-III C-methyltransferase n=1 Tax=Sedimenticola selenatireducens TaxID=191960 RepID=UPI003F4AE500